MKICTVAEEVIPADKSSLLIYLLTVQFIALSWGILGMRTIFLAFYADLLIGHAMVPLLSKCGNGISLHIKGKESPTNIWRSRRLNKTQLYIK